MSDDDYKETMTLAMDAIIDVITRMSEQMTALNVAVQRSNRRN